MSVPTERNEIMISRWQWWGSWRRAWGDAVMPSVMFDEDRPPPTPGSSANPTLAFVLEIEKHGKSTPMRVERCYRSLSDELRTVARGRYLLGFSWPRIAAETGLTVKQLEHRHTEILHTLGEFLDRPYIVQGDEVPT